MLYEQFAHEEGYVRIGNLDKTPLKSLSNLLLKLSLGDTENHV